MIPVWNAPIPVSSLLWCSDSLMNLCDTIERANQASSLFLQTYIFTDGEDEELKKKIGECSFLKRKSQDYKEADIPSLICA